MGSAVFIFFLYFNTVSSLFRFLKTVKTAIQFMYCDCATIIHQTLIACWKFKMVYVMFYVVMLCYVMLCYVMLCYVMLCYVMLCYVMLCYVMLCYVMLCYVMLCYVMLCYSAHSPLGLFSGRLHQILRLLLT